MRVDEGKVRDAGFLRHEQAHEPAAAAHVEKAVRRLRLARGDLREGEAARVRATVAEAAREAGEQHLLAVRHAGLPVRREVAPLCQLAVLHHAEHGDVLRARDDVHVRPHEAQRAQGVIRVALERGHERAALGELGVEVLELVEHELRAHRLRGGHEEGERERPLGKGGRAVHDRVRVDPRLGETVADRARVVEVERMRGHALRPFLLRLQRQPAAAIAGDEHARAVGKGERGQEVEERGLGVGELAGFSWLGFGHRGYPFLSRRRRGQPPPSRSPCRP